VLGAVTMPVAGAAIGNALAGTKCEMVRGLASTPAAMKERSAGRGWGEETRTWITYSLPDEATKTAEVGICLRRKCTSREWRSTGAGLRSNKHSPTPKTQ
jgi:hypothetical protein